MQPTMPLLDAIRTESDRTGFDQAEAVEALVVEDHGRPHQEEVQDLVHLADFLVPELHRAVPTDAAEVITEWADGDPDLLSEAEGVAREKHHDESAQLLHQAVEYASAA
ncbi:MAG: hypothetical protein ACRDY6_11375 [Acidimicrobiia bacterium]